MCAYPSFGITTTKTLRSVSRDMRQMFRIISLEIHEMRSSLTMLTVKTHAYSYILVTQKTVVHQALGPAAEAT